VATVISIVVIGHVIVVEIVVIGKLITNFQATVVSVVGALGCCHHCCDHNCLCAYSDLFLL
jgi:hypothetical protein